MPSVSILKPMKVRGVTKLPKPFKAKKKEPLALPPHLIEQIQAWHESEKASSKSQLTPCYFDPSTGKVYGSPTISKTDPKNRSKAKSPKYQAKRHFFLNHFRKNSKHVRKAKRMRALKTFYRRRAAREEISSSQKGNKTRGEVTIARVRSIPDLSKTHKSKKIETQPKMTIVRRKEETRPSFKAKRQENMAIQHRNLELPAKELAEKQMIEKLRGPPRLSDILKFKVDSHPKLIVPRKEVNDAYKYRKSGGRGLTSYIYWRVKQLKRMKLPPAEEREEEQKIMAMVDKKMFQGFHEAVKKLANPPVQTRTIVGFEEKSMALQIKDANDLAKQVRAEEGEEAYEQVMEVVNEMKDKGAAPSNVDIHEPLIYTKRECMTFMATRKVNMEERDPTEKNKRFIVIRSQACSKPTGYVSAVPMKEFEIKQEIMEEEDGEEMDWEEDMSLKREMEFDSDAEVAARFGDDEYDDDDDDPKLNKVPSDDDEPWNPVGNNIKFPEYMRESPATLYGENEEWTEELRKMLCLQIPPQSTQMSTNRTAEDQMHQDCPRRHLLGASHANRYLSTVILPAVVRSSRTIRGRKKDRVVLPFSKKYKSEAMQYKAKVEAQLAQFPLNDVPDHHSTYSDYNEKKGRRSLSKLRMSPTPEIEEMQKARFAREIAALAKLQDDDFKVLDEDALISDPVVMEKRKSLMDSFYNEMKETEVDKIEPCRNRVEAWVEEQWKMQQEAHQVRCPDTGLFYGLPRPPRNNMVDTETFKYYYEHNVNTDGPPAQYDSCGESEISDISESLWTAEEKISHARLVSHFSDGMISLGIQNCFYFDDPKYTPLAILAGQDKGASTMTDAKLRMIRGKEKRKRRVRGPTYVMKGPIPKELRRKKHRQVWTIDWMMRRVQIFKANMGRTLGKYGSVTVKEEIAIIWNGFNSSLDNDIPEINEGEDGVFRDLTAEELKCMEIFKEYEEHNNNGQLSVPWECQKQRPRKRERLGILENLYPPDLAAELIKKGAAFKREDDERRRRATLGYMSMSDSSGDRRALFARENVEPDISDEVALENVEEEDVLKGMGAAEDVPMTMDDFKDIEKDLDDFQAVGMTADEQFGVQEEVTEPEGIHEAEKMQESEEPAQEDFCEVEPEVVEEVAECTEDAPEKTQSLEPVAPPPSLHDDGQVAPEAEKDATPQEAQDVKEAEDSPEVAPQIEALPALEISTEAQPLQLEEKSSPDEPVPKSGKPAGDSSPNSSEPTVSEQEPALEVVEPTGSKRRKQGARKRKADANLCLIEEQLNRAWVTLGYQRSSATESWTPVSKKSSEERVELKSTVSHQKLVSAVPQPTEELMQPSIPIESTVGPHLKPEKETVPILEPAPADVLNVQEKGPLGIVESPEADIKEPETEPVQHPEPEAIVDQLQEQPVELEEQEPIVETAEVLKVLELIVEHTVLHEPEDPQPAGGRPKRTTNTPQARTQPKRGVKVADAKEPERQEEREKEEDLLAPEPELEQLPAREIIPEDELLGLTEPPKINSNSPELFLDPSAFLTEPSEAAISPQDSELELLYGNIANEEDLLLPQNCEVEAEQQLTAEQLLDDVEMEPVAEEPVAPVNPQEPEKRKRGRPRKKSISAESRRKRRAEQNIDIIAKVPATRSKTMFLSKNNPAPRVRGINLPGPEERLTGVAPKGLPLNDSPDSSPEKILPMLKKAIKAQVAQEVEPKDGEVVDVEKEIVEDSEIEVKQEDPDEAWVAPAPILEYSRKSKKRRREEMLAKTIENIKTEDGPPVDDEIQVLMTNIAIKTEVEDDECVIIQANFNVPKAVDVEPETQLPKILESTSTHRF
ncbi:unnamed protein product [Caenorhabditis sp. 36 PRJEB53466]|nr:unnamed protein product [Caenorhabditis sp. 36 PRJEB53466]